MRLITTSRTCPASRRSTSSWKRVSALVEVRPPPWNCRNSTFGFSRAKIAVTIGTKAPGRRPVELHRERVADDRDPLGRQGPIVGIRAATAGSSSSSFASTFSSRMPRFFSPQFQFLRPAICHSAALVPTGDGAGLALERPADGQEVLVAAGQAELAEVDRQPEAGVEREQLLQAVAVALDLEVRLEEARDRAYLDPGRLRALPRASA